MTDRNRISKLHIIILLMFLVSIVSGSQPCKANVLGAEEDLTAEEELTIRNAVYSGEYSFKSEYTKTGKIAELSVPNEVTAIYERKPNSAKNCSCKLSMVPDLMTRSSPLLSILH